MRVECHCPRDLIDHCDADIEVPHDGMDGLTVFEHGANLDPVDEGFVCIMVQNPPQKLC